MTVYQPVPDAAIAPSKAAASTAVSPVADALRPALNEAVQTMHTLGIQRQADLILALIEACSYANAADWDSYGGRGVSLGSYLVTECLLRTFPDRLPLPEISVHPDGELALDWIVGRRQMFAISVGEDGSLLYAGLFGKNKVSGKEIFAGIFPVSLLPHIKRLSEVDGDDEQT
jgi:hypothetical protein